MKAVEICDAQFSYREAGLVLKIDHFELSSGETLFIYGPSGSGKTTLLNLLAGVATVDKGSVSVLGQRLELLGGRQRDRFRGDHVGFIFQRFNLIPYLSVLENVTLPLRVSKARTSRLKKGARQDALELLDHLRLSDIVDRSVPKLSVGERQRVAVARALIGTPEIVIADEPTSSLDECVTESFIELLLAERSHSGFGMVFVSHDRRLAKFFDRSLDLREINGVARG